VKTLTKKKFYKKIIESALNCGNIKDKWTSKQEVNG